MLPTTEPSGNARTSNFKHRWSIELGSAQIVIGGLCIVLSGVSLYFKDQEYKYEVWNLASHGDVIWKSVFVCMIIL